MNFLEEESAFLNHCGLSRPDGEKDGVPCEAFLIEPFLDSQIQFCWICWYFEKSIETFLN